MAESRILLTHSSECAIYACQCGAIHVLAGEIQLSFSFEEFVITLEIHHQAIGDLGTNLVARADLCRKRNAITIGSSTPIESTRKSHMALHGIGQVLARSNTQDSPEHGSKGSRCFITKVAGKGSNGDAFYQS